MFTLDRWQGKIAVVTGASAGIGAATAVALANQGLRVVGVARRVDRIEALKVNVKKGAGELHAFQADVGKEKDIEALFNFVRSKFGTVHVLVNNAGLFRMGGLIEQDPKHIKTVIDVNLLGLTLCTQQAIKLMKETQVDDGHIIHINSICGHHVTNPGNGQFSSIYSATKFAVTAVTEQLRQELVFAKSNIRVTSISPGYVATEIVQAGVEGVGGKLDETTMGFMKTLPHLESEDISDAILYVLSTPPRVQIHELTIKPVGEMY